VAVGRLKVELRITEMDRARLLVVEMTELEKELELAGLPQYAKRINHALARFLKPATTDEVHLDAPDD
jgi:hypothetical protein